MTLTYDFDLYSPASYGHDLVYSRAKVQGQSVPKIQWKQTDGRTDGGDYITCLANAVGNKPVNFCSTLMNKQLQLS